MIKKIAIILGSIFVSLGAGAIGSLATVPNIPTWYANLEKPPLLPPNEVFGPVWTVLYVLMGIALALVILQRSAAKKTRAYIWFAIQLALNTAWSITFFGLQLPWVAAVIIVLLLAAILMTMRHFHDHKSLAAYLLIPYVVWVCFATYLNVGVAILN